VARPALSAKFTLTVSANSEVDKNKKDDKENGIDADANAINVKAIRTPLRTLYIQKGKLLTAPIVLDGPDGKPQTDALTWTSSKPEIAAVNAKGKITAKRAGSAIVTVKASNGVSLKITVKVVKKAVKLKSFTVKAPKSLKANATYQTKITLKQKKATNVKITFKSSKPGVIQVDKAGKLTALKKGTAKITITAGTKKLVKTIKVK
jgi:uncharacterized protein YjdB